MTGASHRPDGVRGDGQSGFTIDDLSERTAMPGARRPSETPGLDPNGAIRRVRGQARRDLHWWLGAGLVAFALPMLVWQAFNRESSARAANRQGVAQRAAADVRPPDSTTALERTIREQLEAVTPGATAYPPLPPLPPLAASSVSADAAHDAPVSNRYPPLNRVDPVTFAGAQTRVAALDVRTDAPRAATGLPDPPDARLARLAAESERRMADASTSPVLMLGSTAGPGSPAGRGGAASTLEGAMAAMASGLAASTSAPALRSQDAGDALMVQALARLRDPGTGAESAGAAAAPSDRRWLDPLQSGAAGRTLAPLVARASPGAGVVMQATVLPAVLVTEINSELPGPLTAQTTQDVWDSTDGTHLLIPRGARLIGAYNSDVRPGQERVLAAFTRLILPGGASVDLLGMQAADAQGRSGLNDRVDQHFWQMFGSSFVIAGLASLVQRRESQPSTVVVVPGAASGSSAPLSSAAGTVLVETARTVLGRNRNIAPTLIIRQGHRFTLTVQRDFLVAPDLAGTKDANPQNTFSR